ncbi:hypothetical protein [Anthocerotibacter panamensis]|uniref:hypothetical protein n=1 Tax=Anthocerotibacter panamensis TaxID=2857077 RepID=UPI001C4044A0|nr:hypothetical protein [Anthocerotibacter panamensis]
MKRRTCLGFILLPPALTAQTTRPLADFLPMLQKDLLAYTNRAYRRANLASRAVFLGVPRLVGEDIVQVRMLERWPSSVEPPALNMLMVDHSLQFARDRNRWFLVGVSLGVAVIPPEAKAFGPTSQQLLNPQAPLSHQTVGTPVVDASDSPFAQAVRTLLQDWQ